MISPRILFAAIFAVTAIIHPAEAADAAQPRYFYQSEKSRDETAKYLHYNFSGLLWPQSRFLGFIGADFQRLKIIFTSLSRDAADPTLYHVRGYSTVRANSCDFEGTLRVTRIGTWGKDFSDAQEYEDIKARAFGEFHAAYELREDASQPSSGVFKGDMALLWYIDRDGQLLYDRVTISSDGYGNNAYEGTWTSYKSGREKTANWGEYRIPEHGDLDTGVGEFLPNEKYRKNGWDDPEWSPQPQKN